MDTYARLDTDVKQMTNKDGSGKGQMAAWKVSCLRGLWLLCYGTTCAFYRIENVSEQ